jgi:subtilase family serine protease
MRSATSRTVLAVTVSAGLLIPFELLAQDNRSQVNALQSPSSQPQPLQTVPPWVKRARLLGPAEDGKRVLITAYLSWQNQAELKQLLAELTSPASARYGQFLTPEQFRAQFSPRAQDIDLLQNTLRGLGFTINYTPDSGLFVRASGTVAQVKQAFHISQNLYAYRGKTLRAHAEEPTLPAALQKVVTYIAGLDDAHPLMRPLHVAALEGPASVNTSAVQPPSYGSTLFPCSNYWGDLHATLIPGLSAYPTDLPWRQCGLTPDQVRQAYGVDRVRETGRGVRVAITDLYASPTIVSDVNSYSARHGLPLLTPANFRQRLPAGVNVVPPGDPCSSGIWFGEETLDVESLHSIAPDADILYVAGACDVADEADGGVGIDPIYEVIDHHLADIVSNSWLYNGEADVSAGELQSDNAEFIQAALQGMSVVFATGDDGDLLMSGIAFGGPNPVASGSWPSTSPYVTALGGTSVLLKNSSGEKEEYGWGTWETVFVNPLINSSGTQVTQQGYITPFFWNFGSGGGPSLVMPQPFYQAKVVPERFATQTLSASGQVIPISPPARVVPDIAMLGDPFIGLLVGETTLTSTPPEDPGCTQLSSTLEYCETPVGGTSLAAPMFAGVLALVNEARFRGGKGPVGFVNPALYSLRVGQKWFDYAPIMDVNAPSQPIGALIGILGFNNIAGFFTVDSNLDADGNVVENADSSLRSAPGYDVVTGLGAPNVPALIEALRH